MKKASIFVMIIAVIIMIVFTILFWHPITDNAVDSDGFWAYMYGPKSTMWPVFSGGVIFLMGLTCYIATWAQPSARYK